MEQIQNGMMAMLNAATQMAGAGMTGGKKDLAESSDFQKLLERAQNPQDVEQPQSAKKPQAKPERKDSPADSKAEPKEQAPVQEPEDPVETSKRMQVYLAPVDPDVLAQYPAEWLPQVKEGEPIVCVGVRTGANGENIPILMGADAAEQMYGKQVVDPAVYAADPEGDAMLEATDPTVEHKPAQLLEQAADKTAGQVMRQAVAESVQPQGEEDEIQTELSDGEQAAQPLFKDVKAAPVKVGEAPAAQQSSQSADVGNQLAGPLTHALAQGDTKVEIQLTPDYLGSVKVEIVHSQDGMLHVTLSAESSQTRSLLERHAASLQLMLGSQRQETVQVQVQHQEESQQGQNHSYDGHSGNQAYQQEQEQQNRRRHTQNSADFLQQLRLGLIPSDGE